MRFIGTGELPPIETHEVRLKEIRDLAILYRPQVRKGMNSPALHAELNRQTFANGESLTPAVIASIVNFCFYQGNTNEIARIMGEGRI
jgi:hypothetical protein